MIKDVLLDSNLEMTSIFIMRKTHRFSKKITSNLICFLAFNSCTLLQDKLLSSNMLHLTDYYWAD